MLPTHGLVSGAFLLANASRHRKHRDLDDWIGEARQRSSFMAGAVDLERCAEGLVRLGLAMDADSVTLSPALSGLSERADRPTFVAIAALLLELDPPPWLRLAVHEGAVLREYVPSVDLRDLLWLDPFLDELLVGAAAAEELRHVEPLRRALGRAGELVIMAAAASAGLDAWHVADVSDAFGYDVEIRTPRVRRLEVKSTTQARQGLFHLSRNEFDKSKRHAPDWWLVQVTFDSAVFTDSEITAAHVLGIRELAARGLWELVPTDSKSFRWSESAVITPPDVLWRPFELPVPESFRLPGLRSCVLPRRSDELSSSGFHTRPATSPAKW